MKKKYTDAQSYFQDWAQVKRKEVQNMEEWLISRDFWMR